LAVGLCALLARSPLTTCSDALVLGATARGGPPAPLDALVAAQEAAAELSGPCRRSALAALAPAVAAVAWGEPVHARQFEGFKRIQTQFIAALGDPSANSGTGAQLWGLWRLDPGPRGVALGSYGKLKANGGTAPARWKFDSADWWLEEHGLIMEQPDTPMPPGRYVVTGAREVTTILTVEPSGAWRLDDGAKLFDVTHLPCRSARYTGEACSPDRADQSKFPVTPGGPMPPVEGCSKQDYAVLFVIGAEA